MNILGSLMLVLFITRASVAQSDPPTAKKTSSSRSSPSPTSITASTTKTAAPTTTAAPVIPNGQDPLVHYLCSKTDSSYTIAVSIKKNATLNYYAIMPDKSSFAKTGTCVKNFTGITGKTDDVKVTVTGCNTTVYLYIMTRPAFLKSTPKPGTTLPVIAGGKSFHEFVINCKVQARGSLYNLTTSFTDIKINDSGKTIENPDLKLALSIEGSSTIYIGDEVKLNVKDTTDVKNFLSFTDCFATDAKNNDISSIRLIKNGSAVETDIIASVNKVSTRGTNSLVFYAFRFATSSEVKISCTIKACPNQGCTPSRRRRRSVNNELSSDSKTVSVTFEVHDKKESSGGIKVGHVSPLLMTAIVFGWIKLL